MDKRMPYYVVQKFENGKWVNSSVRYFLQGLKGALHCFNYLKITYPNNKYRIAKGKDKLEIWPITKR